MGEKKSVQENSVVLLNPSLIVSLPNLSESGKRRSLAAAVHYHSNLERFSKARNEYVYAWA